ncbi:MAG: acyl carrier protein [Burkholderiales bacterium]
MSLFTKVQEAIAATLNVPAAKISETTRDEDIAAWDSLGQVNLMMALEQTFDVYLDVEEFQKLNSVPAILEFLERQGIA